MKTILFPNITKTKKHISSNETLYCPNKQNSMLYQLYLEEHFDEKNELLKEITKKLQGYKQQDKKHSIYSKQHFICKDTTIQRLVECKLICFYCKTKLMLFYKESKQPNQWTLDRIDNSMGHNHNNIVISCLDCNLKRRTTDLHKFLYTKQLSITRLDN
jgi:hypothetical protein